MSFFTLLSSLQASGCVYNDGVLTGVWCTLARRGMGGRKKVRGLRPAPQVSTGVTLRENNLKQIEGGRILGSQGVLVANRAALTEQPGLLAVVHELIERLEVRTPSPYITLLSLPQRGAQGIPPVFTGKGCFCQTRQILAFQRNGSSLPTSSLQGCSVDCSCGYEGSCGHAHLDLGAVVGA